MIECYLPTAGVVAVVLYVELPQDISPVSEQPTANKRTAPATKAFTMFITSSRVFK